MRAAPPVEVVVSRFGIWRASLLVLGCVGAALPWYWLLDRSVQAPLSVWLTAALASCAACVAVGWVRLDNRAFALRWDGEHWTVAFVTCGRVGKAHRSPVSGPWLAMPPPDGAAARYQDGSMSVVIDLGSWMLLRFDRASVLSNLETANAATDVNLQTSISARRAMRHERRRSWLPLQSAGLEPQWHRLRCALYSRAATTTTTATALEPSRSLNTSPSA